MSISNKSFGGVNYEITISTACLNNHIFEYAVRNRTVIVRGVDMIKKFQVYAQTRATRQLAEDVAQMLKNSEQEMRQWQEIEDKLQDIECKLERMNLTD
jgi:sensor histidine kinase YesM